MSTRGLLDRTVVGAALILDAAVHLPRYGTYLDIMLIVSREWLTP
jgi:hypothetical protein